MGEAENVPGAEGAGPETPKPFERYRAQLHRYFGRRLYSGEDTGDFVQEVHLRYWRFTQSNSSVRNPRALVFKMAHDVLVDFRRKGRLETKPLEAEIVELSQDPWSNVPCERLAALHELERTFLGLSDSERKLMVLDKWAEKTNEELAIEFGVSTAVLRLRKTRLNQKLADIQKEEG